MRITTLRRLNVVYLLMGMMFFYGIEQLFLDKYLHNPSARGYVTIVFSLGLLAFDIPMGILADRIGRKLCLVAACLAQMAGTLVMGLSNSLGVYLIGTVLFSVYLCLFNGAAQALLYDWLESTKQTKLYARHQGKMYAWWLTGAGVANLLSGILTHFWGLRSGYFLSVVPGVLALIALSGLAEPPFKKKQAAAWYTHVAEALSELRANKRVIGFALQFVAATVVLLTIGEFGQIYILSFGVSAVMLGIYWAIDAAFAAGGRVIAHRLQTYPRLAVITLCAALAFFATIHSAFGIGVFWLVYGLNEALSNIAETELQDATMLSTVSFIGNLVATPIVLLFTALYRHHGIMSANRTVAFAVIGLLLATLLARPEKHHIADQALEPSPEVTI